SGSPPAIPALLGIERILTDQQIADTIRQGRGRMPPFNSLSEDQVQAVVHYLTRAPQQQSPRPRRSQRAPSSQPQAAVSDSGGSINDMPYKTIGFRRFLDPQDYPAT